MEPQRIIEGLDANYSYYQLWTEYRDVGPSLMLICTASLLNAVVVPGICMNLAIVYVTLKYKNLRGTSSFLLALTALYECVHECGHLLFLFVAASGRNFVPYLTVFRFLALPLVGCTASLAAIAFTGLDRLLQIAFSKWHEDVNRTLYLGTFTLLSLLSGLLMCAKYAEVAFAHPDFPQTGTISDIFLFDFKPIFFSYMLLANFVAIAFYVGVWLAVKWEKAGSTSVAASTHNTRANHRLFKSLFAIIAITIGSYLVTAVVRLFALPPLHLSQVHVWFVELYFGILLNVGAAANAPVLYVCSKDYREVFSRELQLVAKCVRLRSNVVPSAVFSTLGSLHQNGKGTGQQAPNGNPQTGLAKNLLRGAKVAPATGTIGQNSAYVIGS